VKLCVVCLTKKISHGCPAVTAAWICPGQLLTIAECSRFHQNRFTFGGVIAERVNTTKKRRKVNSIFRWSLASSRIMMCGWVVVVLSCARYIGWSLLMTTDVSKASCHCLICYTLLSSSRAVTVSLAAELLILSAHHCHNVYYFCLLTWSYDPKLGAAVAQWRVWWCVRKVIQPKLLQWYRTRPTSHPKRWAGSAWCSQLSVCLYLLVLCFLLLV